MDGQAMKKAEVEPIKLIPSCPHNKTSEEPKLNLSTGQVCPKFEVCCHAEGAGHLEVVGNSVSVRIGQRVRNEGKEEFWGSLLVEAKEQDDGSLAVEVVVFHPDWDEPLRVASIQSNPSDPNAPERTLRCDLEQKHL